MNNTCFFPLRSVSLARVKLRAYSHPENMAAQKSYRTVVLPVICRSISSVLFIISNAFATNEKGEKELVHIIHLNIYDRHLKYITLLLVPNGGMVGVESE